MYQILSSLPLIQTLFVGTVHYTLQHPMPVNEYKRRRSVFGCVSAETVGTRSTSSVFISRAVINITDSKNCSNNIISFSQSRGRIFGWGLGWVFFFPITSQIRSLSLTFVFFRHNNIYFKIFSLEFYLSFIFLINF